MKISLLGTQEILVEKHKIAFLHVLYSVTFNAGDKMENMKHHQINVTSLEVLLTH
jgi:hypothetical protein